MIKLHEPGHHLSGGGFVLVFLHLVHELEMFLLFLQGGALLLALLQPLLSAGQLIAQPRVLLAQPAHLRAQLLLLRLHVLQVTRQRYHHLYNAIQVVGTI